MRTILIYHKSRYIFRITLVLLSFSYFFVMAIYLLPANPLKSYVGNRILNQFDHIFYQKWDFFSNPGNVHISLIIKCDNQTDWIDTSAAILAEHQKKRLPPIGKILYNERSYALIANSMLSLRQQEKNQSYFKLESKYSEIVNSFSKSECIKRGLTFDSGEKALLYRKLRKFSERQSSNMFNSYEVIRL